MLLMVTGATPSVYVIFQGPVPVKAILRVADWPLQMVFVPLKTAVGRGFTVTIALPLRSDAIDEHLLSLAEDKVYVWIDEGVTVNEYGLALIVLMVTGVTPSVYVILHGALPVRFTVSVADWPLHIVFVPVNITVGLGFTAITALPLRSVAVDKHLVSLTAVKV